jgi:predicted permease
MLSNAIKVAARRVSGFFRRRRLDSDLTDEIQTHLDLLTDDYVRRGWSSDEARVAAHREFGGVEQMKETYRDQRGLPFLDAAIQDVRFGLRMLRKNPGFTAVVVSSLALGIGANTAIFSVIDALLLKKLPVDRPDELVVLQPTGRGGDGAFSYPGFVALRDSNSVFSDAFTFSSEGLNVIVNGEADLSSGWFVTGNFFSVLRVNAAIGRPIVLDDDRDAAAPVAVISHAYWKKRFALDPSAVGATATINGIPVSIVGVAPPEFFGIAVGSAPDVWIPMAMEPRLNPASTQLKEAGTWWLSVMARLRPGVSERQARANLDVILPVVQHSMGMSELTSTHFSRIDVIPAATGLSSLRSQFSRPLRILMAVVGLVLLLACANVAGLLLSRAGARQREIAIRLSLGGARTRVVRQLLTESLLLALIGGVLGLFFARWSATLLVAFLGASRFPVTLALHLDSRLLAFNGLVSLMTGILFGLAPALHAARVDPGPALKSQTQLGLRRAPLVKALVVAQVAMSLLLLVGAGLFARTVQNLRSGLGFSPQRVLVMTIEPSLAGYKDARLALFYQEVLDRVTTLPGVRSASLARFGLIGAGYSGRRVWLPGYAPVNERDRTVAVNVVGPKFFETSGIPLVAGREFGPGDTATAPKVAIVNEKFARTYLNVDNPVGKRLGFGPKASEDLEIIGVVRDAKYFQLRKDSPPTVAVPFLQSASAQGPGLGRMILEVRTAGDPENAAPMVQRAVQSVARDVPVYGVKTEEQQIDAALAQERLLATLAGFFSLLALFLACAGLYGVLSHAVVQRTSEIGIRMALGAKRTNVVWLVLRDSAMLVSSGVAIGVPAAIVAARFIESQLFGLTVTDPATLLVASMSLTVAAALATFAPAWRATRVDPLVALRYE